MKKLLLLATVFVLSLSSATAQENIVLVKKSPSANGSINANVAKAPQKTELNDGEVLWGYYGGEYNNTYGVGVGSATNYSVAMEVPASLKGCTITAINLPITTKNMSNVSVWVSTSKSATNAVASKTLTASTLSVGYNRIDLDEPVTISDTKLYVGMDFKITSATSNATKYPVCIGVGYREGSLYLGFATNPMEDYSAKNWMWACQLFITGFGEDNGACFSSYRTKVGTADSKISLPVTLTTDSQEPVSSIGYTVDINGDKQTGTLTFANDISAGMGIFTDCNIEFKTPSTTGLHDIVLSVDKINGKDNKYPDQVLNAKIKVVSELVNRIPLVEELTGTLCGYCPRGWAGLEYLKEVHPEASIAAVHHYDLSDPMFIYNYEYMGFYVEGAPGAIIDKHFNIDPYYGAKNDTYGTEETPRGIVDAYEAVAREDLADVKVEVDGMFDDDEMNVDATANVTYLYPNSNLDVVFVLTADGLTGSTTNWKQSNNYYRNTQQWCIDKDQAELAIFCKGGEYGKSSFYIPFNDVVVSSSRTPFVVDAKGNMTDTGHNQVPKLEAGDTNETREATFSIPLPAQSTALYKAIDRNKVNVIAYVMDSNGVVLNSVKAKVKRNPNAISGITVSDSNVEVARYNAAGQQIATPQKGINIVKYSNGTSRKVIVK